jgi:hypothetical protein
LKKELPKKVYIEGANLAALTAAARLSKFKYQVTLNGDTYRNTVIDSFSFDTAPLFTLPAVYRDFFQKTGKHFGQVLNVIPMDPAFRFDFGELQINFANLSRSARLKEITEKLGADAAVEWEKALKQGEYLWDRIRENMVEWEFSLLRFNPDTYLRMRAPLIRNPYLNKIMAHYSTYLGYPAGIYKWSHIAAFVEESFGIWQIEGGLEALTESVKNRALELGTTFGQRRDFDYYIDATQTHSVPTQRLIGISDYPGQLPIRTVQFHKDGKSTDIYASQLGDLDEGMYSLVLTGDLSITDFDSYARVDQIRQGQSGDSDNQLVIKIRTPNKRKLKVRHLDSLAHAGIAGELLANAVRGIKNRPSHEH